MTSLSIEDVLIINEGQEKTTLSFFVVGDPPVQERTKMNYKGRFKAHMYDPSSSEKLAFGRAVVGALGDMGEVLGTTRTGNYYYFQDSTSIALDAKFVLSRPLSHFKGNGLSQRLRDDVVDYPERKDIDNLLKFLMDSVQFILYKDDNAVTKVTMEKQFACPGEPVGMQVSFSGKRSISK
jgi:Holliday junction resolvase RusA-like endonuclease